ncbi:hypothetical protein [Tateyamaria sp. SN6-1]|uniref:hypothetical protein n=1 Tax=Tateyamaria sp. SN6-1 TaxID=3092148 RepID=UPI0039F59587
MTKSRAKIGFSDELDDLSKIGSADAVGADLKRQTEAARGAAAQAGFIREGHQQKPLRRRRTGRNAQLNIKAKPETIEAYCRIADEHGWGLGETLEYAVELLDKQKR